MMRFKNAGPLGPDYSTLHITKDERSVHYDLHGHKLPKPLDGLTLSLYDDRGRDANIILNTEQVRAFYASLCRYLDRLPSESATPTIEMVTGTDF